MMTQTPKHRWHGQGVADGYGCLFQSAGLDLPQHKRNVETQRTQAITRRKTITDVIAEKQLKGGTARLVDLISFAFDDHAGCRFRSAGRHKPAIYLYQTNETRR